MSSVLPTELSERKWKMLQTRKNFNICLNFTTKDSKIQFLTNFLQFAPNRTNAKLILLKKRNFFAKSSLGCNWLLYVKNWIFGFIFETS
jgi:hypothetical protein